MTWTQAIITYFCLWWVVWLAVLPFGVRRIENPDPLHDPGAPANTRLWPKFLITTLLAAVLTFGTMEALNAGWVRLNALEDI